jgi:tetratricopeptide (TPR) repeat protein
MSKNLLFCVAGIALGFFVGFLITNAVTKPGVPTAAADSRSAAGRAPGPLKPEQMAGDLPVGHPEVGEGGAGSAASTSARAQAAMDKADRSPKEFAAQVEAAEVFYTLRDYEKAALYLDRALAIKPSDFDALVLMGNVKYDAKQYADAATFYERALAIKPDTPDVRTDLGNTYFNREDFDRAIGDYRKAVAVDPFHLNAWRNIATAAIRKGDKATATEAVEKLQTIAPQSEELPAFRESIA